MSTLPAETSALRTVTEAVRADEYVEFWSAGSTARGLFSCVGCGQTVRSAHQLPSCPNCEGVLWEKPFSSPFTQSGTTLADRLSAYEDWKGEDLDSTAGLVRGVSFALVIGPLFWLLLAVSAYVLLR